ncbi:syntaxin-17 isoform X4 [Lithobates pipiens]
MESEQKVPYRRLESAVLKFTKVVIPTDLERLKNHQLNIEKAASILIEMIPAADSLQDHFYRQWEKCPPPPPLSLLSSSQAYWSCRQDRNLIRIANTYYRKCKSWDQLHKEHINAGRTVQQLRANIREMESLFLKVRNEDIQTLTTVLQPVKKLALDSITNFLKLHSNSAENLLVTEENFSEEQNSISKGSGVKDSESQIDAQFLEIQDQIASESWNSLEKDLLDLNDMVNEFSHLVHFPSTPLERQTVASHFADRWDVSNCGGVIDG